jgi:hypothetical protein
MLLLANGGKLCDHLPAVHLRLSLVHRPAQQLIGTGALQLLSKAMGVTSVLGPALSHCARKPNAHTRGGRRRAVTRGC